MKKISQTEKENKKIDSKQYVAESLKCEKLIREARDDRRLCGWQDWVQQKLVFEVYFEQVKFWQRYTLIAQQRW